MKPINNKLMIVKVVKTILLTVCLLFLQMSAFADYEIRRHTIDTGGRTSNGGQYTVMGTIGQPDAAYSGGDYELLGGFWPAGPLCIVDFEHFARFAQWWLYIGDCSADLYKDGDNIVNYLDLDAFVYEWLYYCPLDWPLR